MIFTMDSASVRMVENQYNVDRQCSTVITTFRPY
ncbi:hypothetical protein ATE92_1277 [Ulvibacter sp. MAR_2010_11]|nr:hypothetical protein ATE92_1277 [Ulvibacter sp. MAR_2010_11]